MEKVTGSEVKSDDSYKSTKNSQEQSSLNTTSHIGDLANMSYGTNSLLASNNLSQVDADVSLLDDSAKSFSITSENPQEDVNSQQTPEGNNEGDEDELGQSPTSIDMLELSILGDTDEDDDDATEYSFGGNNSTDSPKDGEQPKKYRFQLMKVECQDD